MIRKGIILAGGKGTRMSPLTKAVNKQLLPIYDKPLIFYPLSILMLAKIKDILIIVNKGQLNQYKKIIPNGKNLGIKITYLEQSKPRGLPDAFVIGEKFIGKDNVAMILGDNFFYGQNLTTKLIENTKLKKGARVVLHKVQKPELFGVALDGETGVAVDNFAMRGSSAIGYHTMNRKIYAQQLKQLNVRCIIFQYGINVVPNVRKDYSYYTKMLVKELRSIKRAYPGISIIVVGPSDMSRNLNGQKVSYPNIALINREMQNAAFETGCAFWDLYSAMGGKNSMPQWVSKGLAQKDYTHFSYNGAKYVGEMLFEAILEQVQNQGYLN